jgi:hypothetical protein
MGWGTVFHQEVRGDGCGPSNTALVSGGRTGDIVIRGFATEIVFVPAAGTVGFIS